MKIDVVFTPQALSPTDLAGRTVVVVDILRATTTIAVALANGAKAVLPAGTTDEALRIAQNLERDAVVLAGERKSERIPGFANGNGATRFSAACQVARLGTPAGRRLAGLTTADGRTRAGRRRASCSGG